jgi:nucleotide-binding universal stress UspA family protein
VIAGVSGSLRSLGALRAGAAEARSSGAALLAVLAWAPAGGEVAYLRAPCPLLLRLWERAAHERMREAFDAAFGGMPDDIPVRTLVVRARPGPLLVELADQPDDLLVVGYGGRSQLGRSVHGSVTRHCLARATCPVLAVPPPDLITELRPWPVHWRAEDFAVPLVGAEQATRRRADDDPAAGAGSRAMTSHTPARAESGFPAASDLPRAYQGAPYYQPGPPSRRARAFRLLRHCLLLVAAALLVVVIGILLTSGSSLP